MIRIVLTEEQMKAISGSHEPIDLVDPSGRMLGRVRPETAAPNESKLSPHDLEVIAEVKRRMAVAARDGGTFYSTQEVLDHLKSLGDE